MHHANAAGSRPTAVARSPVPAPCMQTSSAVVRQPLTELDINQQEQHPRQTESVDRAGGQAVAGCPVSMSTEQHQYQQQQQMQDWDLQSEDAEVTFSHSSRDAAGSTTARRLDQELQLMQEQQESFQRERHLQSNQQTAGCQHQLPVEAKKVLKDSPEPRHVESASHQVVISAHSDSTHAEHFHSLADMLESSSRCKTDTQTSTAASSIAGRQEDQVASDGSQTKTGFSAMEIVQHAWRHHRLDSSRNADDHAALYKQQWQQQQQQHKLQLDLPAGIPLTPVLSQKAQPRDSLEAGIWKLSSSKGKHQIPPMSAFGPQQQHMPSKGASSVYKPNWQNPNTRNKPLHMVRDSLEAALQKLAARQ